PGSVRPLRPDDHTAVIALDAAAFGAPRGALIERLLQQGEAAAVLDGGYGVTGFAIRRAFGRGQVIGPVVAPDETGAMALGAALGAPGFLRVDVTGNAPRLGAWLTEHGMPQVDTATVMTRGDWAAASPTVRRFALASQAFG